MSLSPQSLHSESSTRKLEWLICRVDIGAAQEAAACLEAAGSEGQLGGILHASGILHDALIGQQTPALVREVYAPKVAGGKALMKVCLPMHAHISRSRAERLLFLLTSGLLALEPGIYGLVFSSTSRLSPHKA